MLETEESSLKLIVTKFCKNCPSCDRVLKRGLGNLNSKHMVSVNNCCLQFSNSRAVFENSRVRFCNLPGYFFVQFVGLQSRNFICEINSYRHHYFGKFCWHIISLQFVNHFVTFLNIFFLINWVTPTEFLQ